jgi:tetratricopeptide (TPR) repeat protein
MKLIFPFAFTFLLAIYSCGNGGEKTKTDSVAKTDSLDLINQMIRKDPANLDLYLVRSKLYMEHKDYDASLADMNRILAIDSNKAEYLVAGADINFYMRRVTRTKQLLDRAAHVNPENVDCLLRLAQLYYFLTEYDSSMKYIDAALHVDVRNAQAYYQKGMVFKDLHDTAKAISSMQTAVEQNPDYYDAYIHLGLLCGARQLPVAESYFQNAIKINPNSEEALYDLGKYYQEIKNWNAAIETYTALLKINPHNFEAHFNLGIIHVVNLNVTDQGMKYFNLAIEDNPKEPRGYYGRGYCFQKNGDLDNAAADYNMALKVDSTYDKAAYALDELDRLRKAGGK